MTMMKQHPILLVQQSQEQKSMSKSRRRPRRVSNDNTVHFTNQDSIREIESVKDLKEEMWYGQDACEQMLKECLPTLNVMEVNAMASREYHSFSRGLEDKTFTGMKRRMQRISQNTEAVLEEQLNQWDSQRYDPEYLAKVSMATSSLCQMDAHITGRLDEAAVVQKRDDTTTTDQPRKKMRMSIC